MTLASTFEYFMITLINLSRFVIIFNGLLVFHILPVHVGSVGVCTMVCRVDFDGMSEVIDGILVSSLISMMLSPDVVCFIVM